jgi:hypothetical protein
MSVGIVHQAKQDAQRFFQKLSSWSMVLMGHLMLPCTGLQMPFVLAHQTMQHTSRERSTGRSMGYHYVRSYTGAGGIRAQYAEENGCQQRTITAGSLKATASR